MAKKQILIVDDEPMIVRMVERVMNASVDCETVTALNAYQALDILKQRSFDVIISDISMPGMDGTQLLEVVKELYPQTIRMFLTARSGESIGLKAVDIAHQYFLKPSSIKVIGDKIRQVLDLQRVLPDACSVDSITSNITTLPSIPAVYHELEEELRSRDPSIEKIGRIIETDISMSAKMLQLINSAFFGLSEHVSRPSQAASLLGLKVIQGLVLATHVFSEWKDSKKVPCFSMQELWDHSLGTASCARDIAEAEGYDQAVKEDVYVAGLFHDVGKLILASNLPESCLRTWEMCRDEKVSQIEAEMKVIGTTHAEIGAYLLAMWGFSTPVIDACAFHHSPGGYDAGSAQKGKTLSTNHVTLVHVANFIDHERKHTSPSARMPISMEYLQKHGLTQKFAAWRKLGLDR